MAENYILAAGNGGETAVFLNHLARYLVSAQKDFRADLISPEGRGGEDILEEWAALWDEGKLPKGASQPKNYAYRVQPVGKHRDKPPLSFAFIDLSGRHSDAFTSKEGSVSTLLQKLTATLPDPKLNFVLILLCGRDEKAERDGGVSDQDAVLARLVAHLKSNFGDEFATRCPVLLLASKELQDAGDSPGVEAFIGENLPATLAALEAWPGRYTLGDLDMGEFEYEDGDGERLLHSPKFDDTARILRWIYFQFTRYPVVEPFFTRLWKSVRRSAAS